MCGLALIVCSVEMHCWQQAVGVCCAYWQTVACLVVVQAISTKSGRPRRWRTGNKCCSDPRAFISRRYRCAGRGACVRVCCTARSDATRDSAVDASSIGRGTWRRCLPPDRHRPRCIEPRMDRQLRLHRLPPHAVHRWHTRSPTGSTAPIGPRHRCPHRGRGLQMACALAGMWGNVASTPLQVTVRPPTASPPSAQLSLVRVLSTPVAAP